MTDQAMLSPFERRLAGAMDAYTAGIIDPTPAAAVASRAMASRRRLWLGVDTRWLRLAFVAGLLLLGVVAATLLAGRRPALGDWVLNVGCGADVTCPEGEGLWISRPGEDVHRRLFSDQPVRMVHATWTPDGRTIVATDQHDLYVSGLDGPSRKVGPCSVPCLGQDDPAVSPDGTMLAYTVSRFPAWEDAGYAAFMDLVVASLAPDGTLGTPRVLVTEAASADGAHQIFGPRWSPDSRSLVFWENAIDGDGRASGSAVFTVNIDDPVPAQLTDWNGFAGDADWSTDGRSIVYSTFPADVVRPSSAAASDLYLIPSTGGAARRITFAPSGSYRSMQPRFRPDGKITYMVAKPGNPEIHVIDPTDLHDETVMTGLTRTQPEWQPVRSE
jgi:Tol biopolymer transport system component